MDDINRIPVVKNIFQENKINREDMEEDIEKMPYLKEYYKNLDDPLVQSEFESILFPLKNMGYKQKQIFRSFIVFRYKDIDDAVDLLSKSNNAWNHKFIKGFKNKCFVCDDVEKNHIGFLNNFNIPLDENNNNSFGRRDSIRQFNIGSEKINEALKRMRSNSIYLNNNFTSNNTKSIKFLKEEENIIKICFICLLEFEEDNKIILGCKHEFCRDCIFYYLEEEIKNSRVESIKCPEKKCFNTQENNSVINKYDYLNENTFTFSNELIQELVSKEIYEKYLDFKVKLLIEKNKDLSFCPIPNCKGYARIDGELLNDNDNNNNIDNQIRLLKDSKIPAYLKKENTNLDSIKIENIFTDDIKENDNLLGESKSYNLNNNFDKNVLKSAPENFNKNISENANLNSKNEKIDKSEPNTIFNISIEGQSNKKLTCIYNHEFCYRCKNAWNENHDCKKDSELLKFSNENSNKLKKCPSCKTWIEKNEGCNHMTCFVCKYEFCWLCMKECLPDHFNLIGTECFGQQFPDENIDPQVFQATNNLRNSSPFLFVFQLSFFFIFYAHHLYFRNNNVNDPERQNQRRGKFCFFLVMFLILLTVWFIMLFFNGVLLISMIKNSTLISQAVITNVQAQSRARKSFCYIFLSNILIWIIFYFPGMIITSFWFSVSHAYLFWKVIS